MRGRPTRVTLGPGLAVDAVKGGDSSSTVVFARLPDWPAMAIWSEWLRDGDTFVDVGANVGLYTLLAADRGCRVLAVEPAPDMAMRLRHHIALNGSADVVVEECALMDKPGRVRMVGPDANRRSAQPGLGEGSVEARTLDELLANVSIRGMKIDVEGNERLVLEGSTAALESGRVELIQLEWNSTSLAALDEDRRPLAELLRAAGFTLFQVEDFQLVGPLDEPTFGGDVFAARRGAVDCLSAWR